MLSTINKGSILEFGAGSGVMALEILKELERQQALPKHYYIMEVSADLRERQQTLFKEKSPEFLPIVQWLDELPAQKFKGVILANEVLDAMPVHKFKIQGGIQEYYIDYSAEKLQWHLNKISTLELEKQINQLNINFAEGYDSEINLLLPAWIASLSDILQQGLILLIDYGFVRHEYYHPDRSCGTLMCHYRHRAHPDPLIFPGIQDMTAHVDFTAVAEAAINNGLTVSGYTHQAGFLINCGITEWLAEAKDAREQIKLNQQVKRLTLPSEMGELFKAMALTKNYETPLLGFSGMSQMEKL